MVKDALGCNPLEGVVVEFRCPRVWQYVHDMVWLGIPERMLDFMFSFCLLVGFCCPIIVKSAL
jgi:hypothetical protein